MEKRYFTSDLSSLLVGLIHLLDRNDLDIGRDVVRAAEIEHFLGLGDAADRRTREAAASHDEAERGDGEGLFRRADQCDVAIAAQKLNVGVDVVIRRDGVEDEVEAVGVLLHLVRVAGNHDFVGAQPKRVVLLAG